MASSREFVEYVMEQLRNAGPVTYKKMFGEYGLFCGRKFFGVVCDDTLFIKITEAGRTVCPGLSEEPPYEGARNYFLVEEIDDGEFLTRLVTATCEALPDPEPKTRRRRRSAE